MLADEGSFSQLVAQLLTRCPDEACASRLQEDFGVLMTSNGLTRSLDR